MHEVNLRLTKATATDLLLISSMAPAIWVKHYTPIIGETQVQYMLEKMYSLQSLTDQVQSKNHVFYLVNLNGDAIGFISVHEEKNGHWFLNKFYILGEKSTQGFGTLAFQKLKQIILPKKITLTVNRQNYKSINFYFKNGFIIDHVADFDIGSGYVMNDFVMTWTTRDHSLTPARKE